MATVLPLLTLVNLLGLGHLTEIGEAVILKFSKVHLLLKVQSPYASQGPLHL